jgi:hypothetical protein
MRILSLIAVAVTVMAFSACSSSKKSAQVDPEYAAWLAQRQQSQYAPQATGQQAQVASSAPVKREEEECITLADDKSVSNLRSYGDATGYVESVLMKMALMNAQENMAVMLQSTINSAAENYAKGVEKDLLKDNESQFESLAVRLSNAVVSDSKVIKRSIYDLPNGQIHVYVCIESTATKEQVSRQAAQVLSESELQSVQAHKDAFAEKMKDLLYKPTN